MSSAYWNQWDRDDLDSWMGIEDEEDDLEVDTEDVEEQDGYCSCVMGCFRCLDISQRDFM